jgi:hypothetical protein
MTLNHRAFAVRGAAASLPLLAAAIQSCAGGAEPAGFAPDGGATVVHDAGRAEVHPVTRKGSVLRDGGTDAGVCDGGQERQ